MGTKASGSRAQVRYGKEVTWGVIPAIAFQNLRFKGESLGYDIATKTSDEIRSDRQVTDMVRVSGSAKGGVDFELSAETYDEMLAGALFGAWAAPVAIAAATISADQDDDSFNDSANGLGGITAGQWVKVAGFTTAANNGYFKVLTVAAGKITVDGALVDEIEGDAVTIGGTMLRNGTTMSSYTLEKEFADVTQFFQYTGMVVNALKLAIASGSMTVGSLDFMGKQGFRTAVTAGTGAHTASNGNEVMNGVTDLKSILLDGDAVGVDVQSININLANGLRTRAALMSLASAGIGSGKCQVSGDLTAYFENGDMYDDYLNGTARSISLRSIDAADKGYIVTLHRTKFKGGEIVAGSSEADVMAKLQFEAMRDPTFGCTIQIDKF